MLILMLAMTAGWKFAFTGMAEETFFIWVISIHVIAWIFQFIGHGVFESIFQVKVREKASSAWQLDANIQRSSVRFGGDNGQSWAQIEGDGGMEQGYQAASIGIQEGAEQEGMIWCRLDITI